MRGHRPRIARIANPCNTLSVPLPRDVRSGSQGAPRPYRCSLGRKGGWACDTLAPSSAATKSRPRVPARSASGPARRTAMAAMDRLTRSEPPLPGSRPHARHRRVRAFADSRAELGEASLRAVTPSLSGTWNCSLALRPVSTTIAVASLLPTCPPGRVRCLAHLPARSVTEQRLLPGWS